MKPEVKRSEDGAIISVTVGENTVTPEELNLSPKFSKVKVDWMVESIKSAHANQKKPSLFEYLDSVNYSKDALDPSGFDPYMTNVFLSYHPDAIAHADYLNSRSQMPNEMQYKYLLSALRPRKRFSKMFKDESDKEFLNVLISLFDVSTEKAKEMARLYSVAEREDLIKRKKNDEKKLVTR